MGNHQGGCLFMSLTVTYCRAMFEMKDRGRSGGQRHADFKHENPRMDIRPEHHLNILETRYSTEPPFSNSTPINLQKRGQEAG